MKIYVCLFISLMIGGIKSLEEIKDWGIGSPEVEQLKNISIEEMNNLVNNMSFLTYIKGEPVVIKPENKELTYQLEEFKIIDLDNDGKNELILRGTTTRFSGISIIQKVEKGFIYKGNIGMSLSLDESIKDINKDGKKEIITKEFMIYYAALGWPTWTTICNWDSVKQECINVEKKFPDFYKKQIIPKIEEKINEIFKNERLTDVEKERELSGQYIVLDKANRLVDKNPRIGFDRALKWLRSGDRDLIEAAIKVFEDIGDEDSMKMLEETSTDKDKWIAEKAKRALEAIGLKKQQK